MKNKKSVWLSTFRYVVPADYEAWLEKKASEGWVVERVGQWSSIRLVFHKTEPKKYRYIFDINVHPKADYMETYKQFGWDFIGQMASCFIWRKEYSGERPESFSDTGSVEKRNKNVMNAVMVSFIMFLVAFLAVALSFIFTFYGLNTSDIIQFVIGLVLSLSFALYLGWVIVKIYRNRDR